MWRPSNRSASLGVVTHDDPTTLETLRAFRPAPRRRRCPGADPHRLQRQGLRRCRRGAEAARPQQRGGRADAGVQPRERTKSERVTCGVAVPTRKPLPTYDVKAVQRQLADLHYYAGAIDGERGGAFHSAVMAFQKVQGIGADGI